jgi:O-antigen ligase
MYAAIIALIFLGIGFAWATLNKSGIPAFDWYVSLVFIGLAFVAFWSRPRRLLSPAFPGWLKWTAVGLLLYLIFQAVPLPLAVLNLLSPDRAEMARSLVPVTGPISAAPICVDVAADILWFLTLAGCAAAFFLIRDISFRLQNRLFFAVLPLLVVAACEALLGLVQVAGGAEQAIGSYNNRDHYSCILELTLPVSIAQGLFFFARRSETTSIWPVLQANACWLISLLLTVAILFSLSRAGWFDSFISLLVIVVLLVFPAVRSGGWRLGILGGSILLFLAVLLFASPDAMLTRLVSTLTPDSEARVHIWRELVPLASQFRWFGTGLMGFGPTFLKYQSVINSKTIEFAHNDFLQYLIEMGVIGFVALMACLAGIIWPIAKAAWPSDIDLGASAENRVLTIGCVASFSALFAHSLADFNLYVPANVFAFAWIMGFGSALGAVSAAKTDT